MTKEPSMRGAGRMLWLAVGLVVGGYGAGSGVFGPLATNVLIPSMGWRSTMQLYGLAFLAITLASAWLLKNPPAGYQAPQGTPAAQAKAASRRPG